ncbi:MAG TPA: serine/threonine-protein kinase [Gemmataceae bacterium]|nr:serine/threonine-protein kinase [Gemmataceae bacterium]
MNQHEPPPRHLDPVASVDPAGSTVDSEFIGAETDSQPDSVYPPLVSPIQLEKPVRHSDTTTPQTIGKYLVTAVLGAGAQAVVYRAVHPGLSKEVVIKLGRIPLLGTERDALSAEGKLLAELDHPNLARVFDSDLHEGRPFLVMEYVRGCNLEQLAKPRRLTPRESATLVARLARALAAAHRRGIIHQDIKPRNILIDETGQPRLIDFGLACWRHTWTAELESGSISGTPAYMAPEQARGESDQIDQRSDLFALGGVLYYLLAGKAPFSGKGIQETLERAGRCDFDKASLRSRAGSRRLERICLRAMAAEPADRYASAEAFAADLEKFVRRPRPVLWLAGAGLVGVALAGIGWAMFRTPTSPDPGSPQYLIKLVQRRVQKEDRIFSDLKDVLPLRTGDKLRVQCDLPHGLHPALFWFDTDGKLVQLQGSAQPLGSLDQFEYPRGGLVPVDGSPGTEVVLVCAGRGAAPRLEDLEKLFDQGHPWPRLPAQALVLLNRYTVEIKGARGVRDQPEAVAVTAVQDRMEQLRLKLAGKYEFWTGIAFSHRE